MSKIKEYRVNKLDILLHVLLSMHAGSRVPYVSKPNVAIFAAGSQVLMEETHTLLVRRIVHTVGVWNSPPDVFKAHGAIRIALTHQYLAAHIVSTRYEQHKDTIVYAVSPQGGL